VNIATKPDPSVLSPEAKIAAANSRLRTRNIAIACGLVFLIILFYLITIFKMGGAVLTRAM